MTGFVVGFLWLVCPIISVTDGLLLHFHIRSNTREYLLSHRTVN